MYKFDDYQTFTRTTAVYPGNGTRNGDKEAISYLALKLAGEAGEVSEKIAKAYYRDGIDNEEEFFAMINKELGDVLWYVARLADEFDIDLSTVASTNVNKLRDRQDRGMLKGSGDDR